MTTSQMNTEALSDDSLLPSQRALLNFDTNSAEIEGLPYTQLNQHGMNRLGEVLAYDVTLASIERYGSESLNNSDLGRIALMADKLITYDRHTARYFGLDRSYMIANVSTINDFTFADRQNQVYTPAGYVDTVSGAVKRKAITFEMLNRSGYAGDEGRFDFSHSAELRLYTDNLAATSPIWEYSTGSVSDILPGHIMRLPKGFASEELALSVVNSLTRVVDAARLA